MVLVYSILSCVTSNCPSAQQTVFRIVVLGIWDYIENKVEVSFHEPPESPLISAFAADSFRRRRDSASDRWQFCGILSGVRWRHHRPLSGPYGGLHSGKWSQQPLGCHRSHHHTAHLEGQEDHWRWVQKELTTPSMSCPLLSVHKDRPSTVISAPTAWCFWHHLF